MAASSASGMLGQGPLAVSYPSPMLALQYPLLATSVRILCEQEQASKQSSLMATLSALRWTYRTEGLPGLYRGAHIYALHQATRDLLRFLAERGLVACGWGWEARGALPSAEEAEGEGKGEGAAAGEAPPRLDKGGKGRGADAAAPAALGRGGYCLRLAVKYLIDAACYPLLLASTRAILLRDEASAWQRFCEWREAEGLLSLFGGVAASLVCTAFEEAADALLERGIERSAGASVSSLDKLTLKACSSQVASVFTAPLNHVGVIQRCQSGLPGLPRPRPIWSTVLGLPWLSSLYQLVAFGGVLALNVKMLQLKLEFEEYEEEGGEE